MHDLLALLRPLHSPRGLALHLLYTGVFAALIAADVGIPWIYADEYSPVLYNPSTVSFSGNYNTTWLNKGQEPGRVADEWNAGCTRVATAASFRKGDSW